MPGDERYADDAFRLLSNDRQRSLGYRCQIWSTYASSPGDSGGPVFDWHSGGYGSTIRAVGTHTGAFTLSDGSTRAITSPISGIKNDLGGTLRVF